MSTHSDSDLLTITLADGARRLRSGEVTSRELTRVFLDRIAATDDRVRAFVTVTEQAAMAEAEPTSAWHPHSAPEIDALCLMSTPMAEAVRRNSPMRDVCAPGT